MVFGNDPSAAEVQRVNEQLEQRHYEFRSNCNGGDGDASACHSWGEWLAVVDKNYAGAAEMYQLNCAKNNYAASCFNLGRLKLAGKGVETNDTEAINLFGACVNVLKGLEAFKEACERDDASSCNRVASMYLSTMAATGPIARDPLLAKRYLERACDANFAPACHNLAVMYKKGDSGVEQSEERFEDD
ncbi:hypothetical protein PybrP1_004539 [[Pythium] brassicae (nom. inval.)]|nr:hypothetical protein PybrP1_004539 [[Pythium] brassicae (nom. inval.)]